jgi:RimJ/RimL family protein N-acetyltransferase
MGKFNVVGKGVLIRRIEESDLEILHHWYQDSEFTEFYTPEAIFITRSQLKDFLASTTKVHFENSIRIDFIIENKNGTPVGLADLTAISYRSQHATFSIGIDRNYHNRGYGIESMALILNFAFKELNLIKVCAHIYKENEKALNQAIRFGYKQEGILRKETFFRGNFHDLVYLSIFKEEFYKNSNIVKLITKPDR